MIALLSFQSKQHIPNSNHFFTNPTHSAQERVLKIKKGDIVWLHNFNSKLVIGPFHAASHGDLSISPSSFGGRFSAQVKVEYPLGTPPIFCSAQEIAKHTDIKMTPGITLDESDTYQLLRFFKKQGNKSLERLEEKQVRSHPTTKL